MSQNPEQNEQTHSQKLPVTNHIKQPFFSVKKESETYDITLRLKQPFIERFSHFSVHYRFADKTMVYQSTEADNGQFILRLPLAEILSHITHASEEIIDFSFTVLHPAEKDGESPKEWEHPLSLSQFEQFDAFGLTQTIYQKQVLIPYFSESDDIFSIAVNISVPNQLYFTEHQMTHLQMVKNHLVIKGRITTKAFTLREAAIVFNGRNGQKEKWFSTNHTAIESESLSHLHHYDYSFAVDLYAFVQELLVEGFYDEDFDLYLEIYFNGLYQPIRVPLSTQALTLPKSAYRDTPISYGKSTIVIGLNVEGSQRGISLAFTKYKKEVYAYYKEMAPLLALKAPLSFPKNIWLIGEKPMQAISNGWAFFCYMREQHPEQPVYYIIDEQSQDYKKALAFDGDYIVPFKSKKYIELLFAAKVLLFTERPYDLYPSRSPMPVNMIRSKKILLQKHVLGLEDVKETLGYTAKPFPVDLVLASSKTEERFLQQTLHYPENKIRLTGLARFDALLEESIADETPHQITFYPQEYQFGHRIPKEAVREHAEAFLAYIRNKDFANFLTKNQLTAAVALPKGMTEYAERFEQAGCVVTLQEKSHPYALLNESQLFITDSHPLAFDASFKGVPVLFYQPELLFQKEVSDSTLRHTYLNELPGEIATSQDSLLYMMQQIAEDDFKQSRKNRQKADALLQYPDTQSCDRIYAALSNYLR